jgi:hypothetical protein
MASELKVDKIFNAGGDQDSGINLATNDTIKFDIATSTKATMASTGIVSIVGEGGTTTTNLQQGLCKAWACWQGDQFTTILDSFNSSGGTDNGAGDYTLTITNDMANANYSQVDTHAEGVSNAMSTSNQNSARTKATGSCHFAVSFMAGSGGGNNTRTDAPRINVLLMGDLA